MSTLNKIVVGIPTFKRPLGLKNLLESIARQSTTIPIELLIADNDGQSGEGLAVVDRIKSEGYRYTIHSVAVEERGLSNVRNALLINAFEKLGADALLMVDDDERVDEQWVGALLKMHYETRAEIVAGPVFAEFECAPPTWVHGQTIYWGKVHPPGEIDLVSGTGNVFISREVFAKFGAPLFDTQYSLTGGEDKEFFLRLKKMGVRFAFAPDAKTFELVGTTRMTIKWALKRAYRIGNTDMRLFKQSEHSFFAWMRELLIIPVAAVLSIILAIFTILDPVRRMKSVLTCARQCGKLSALVGSYPYAYKATHGK